MHIARPSAHGKYKSPSNRPSLNNQSRRTCRRDRTITFRNARSISNNETVENKTPVAQSESKNARQAGVAHFSRGRPRIRFCSSNVTAVAAVILLSLSLSLSLCLSVCLLCSLSSFGAAPEEWNLRNKLDVLVFSHRSRK